MKTNIHCLSYLGQFFLEWETFQIWIENQNTHFMFNNFFFRKSYLYEITYFLTYSMEQSLSWEANWFSS